MRQNTQAVLQRVFSTIHTPKDAPRSQQYTASIWNLRGSIYSYRTCLCTIGWAPNSDKGPGQGSYEWVLNMTKYSRTTSGKQFDLRLFLSGQHPQQPLPALFKWPVREVHDLPMGATRDTLLHAAGLR